MAKVMVSLPDDLLLAVDAEASRRGMTRSGLLRDLAEESLRRRTARRAQRMLEIRLAPGERRSHGGRVADVLKSHRPYR